MNKAIPGLKTVKNLITTAFKPVGTTMYIYGGGWNENDTSAGKETTSIGLSPTWGEFYNKQTSEYNYTNYDYKKDTSVIHLGLDCSGYIGWVIYNTLNTKNGLDGYVTSSKNIASSLAKRGFGTLTKKNCFTDYKAGDILSASCNDCAHVWLCIGQCSDSSVVLLHSSPPCVMLSGTFTLNGIEKSQAIELATHYMKKYYPDCFKKFPNISRNETYLSHYDRFRWDLKTELTDPDGVTNLQADLVLKEIFND